MRVRKNIFDMELPQWAKLKEAWRSLYDKGLYTKYAVEHTMHYDDRPEEGQWKDHNNAPGFLAFHRSTIQDLETELMQEADDCSLGFPFWDWSMDVGTFATSEIWSEQYMGNSEGCVVSGLPGGWEYEAGRRPPCVERHVEYHNNLYSSLQIAEEIQIIEDFRRFNGQLERHHGVVHFSIGGNMNRKVGRASPSDPMFYLHHAFIDSIYFKWQRSHVDDSRSLLRDALVPFIGRYNEADDCVYLPVHRSFPQNTEATCVHYHATENAHPPDSTLLQAYNADSSCVALHNQIERNECTVEELENIVCVQTVGCTFNETKELEDEAQFERDVLKEQPGEIEKSKEQMHKLYEKIRCKSYSSDFTPAEARLCYKCDVPCKGIDV